MRRSVAYSCSGAHRPAESSSHKHSWSREQVLRLKAQAVRSANRGEIMYIFPKERTPCLSASTIRRDFRWHIPEVNRDTVCSTAQVLEMDQFSDSTFIQIVLIMHVAFEDDTWTLALRDEIHEG